MKKLLIAFFAVAVLAACHENKTPEQLAEEKIEKMEQERMKREVYIDSLFKVAVGLEGAHMQANRQHALDILKKEYPEKLETWAAVQNSIYEMEITDF